MCVAVHIESAFISLTEHWPARCLAHCQADCARTALADAVTRGAAFKAAAGLATATYDDLLEHVDKLAAASQRFFDAARAAVEEAVEETKDFADTLQEEVTTAVAALADEGVAKAKEAAEKTVALAKETTAKAVEAATATATQA